MGLRRRLSFIEALPGGRYAGTSHLADVLDVSRMLRSVRGVAEAMSRGTESQSPPPTMKKRKQRITRSEGVAVAKNAECGVILHRDRNAASNIADNFCRLYEGNPSGSRPRQKLHTKGTARGRSHFESYRNGLL